MAFCMDYEPHDMVLHATSSSSKQQTTFTPAPGELPDQSPLHERNEHAYIREEVPIFHGRPAKGMLRKEHEDRLHGGKGPREEEIHGY